MRIDEHIWLIGQAGVGKTTLAPLIAEELGILKADLDYEIQVVRGLYPTVIIRQEGEKAFRDYETERLLWLAEPGHRPAVIAVGAGAPMRAENREAMKASGTVIYLHTHNNTGWKRWHRHLTYYDLSDITIYTDHQTIEETVATVAERYRKRAQCE